MNRFRPGDLVFRDQGAVLTVLQAEPDSGGRILVMDDSRDEYYLVLEKSYERVGTVDEVTPTECGTSLANLRRIEGQDKRIIGLERAVDVLQTWKRAVKHANN